MWGGAWEPASLTTSLLSISAVSGPWTALEKLDSGICSQTFLGRAAGGFLEGTMGICSTSH